MPQNLLNKKFMKVYGPETLASSMVLVLTNGSAPTVQEAQGMSLSSRTSAGLYVLALGRIAGKNITVQLTTESSTLGVMAQVVSTALSTGLITIQVVLNSASPAASEITGTKVHIFVQERMVS